MVQFIMNDYTGKKITIDEIKEKLGGVYSKLKMPQNKFIVNKICLKEVTKKRAYKKKIRKIKELKY